MSTCISMHGEYSEHTPDEDYICTRCEWLDEDTLIDQARRGRAAQAAIERVETLIDNQQSWIDQGRGEQVITRQGVTNALRRALDGESTG